MTPKETRSTVLHLSSEQKLSVRRIAAITSLSRNTVRKILRSGQAEAEQHRVGIHQPFLKAHSAELQTLYLKCEMRCIPFQRAIEQQFNTKVPLRTLERFCAQIKQEAKLENLQADKPIRYETAPGQQMQIDFGEKDVTISGVLVRVHFFACKLGYSRRTYAKAYLKETQENWLDGIESAFVYFGCIPHVIVCDNASSLVRLHQAPTPEERFTERFYQLCRYYNVKPVATAVRKPRSKGKVESGVKYWKNNALVNVEVGSLEELNIRLEAFARQSDERTLNTVFDGPFTPAERWLLERPKMRRLTMPRMLRSFHQTRKVGTDGLIRVDNQYYRVPDSVIGKEVQVEFDDSVITVLNGTQIVATLNKTADAFNPAPQETSNDAAEQEQKKRLEQIKADPLWAAFRACGDALDRDGKEYDNAVGWQGGHA